jgi:hypothetical protein
VERYVPKRIYDRVNQMGDESYIGTYESYSKNVLQYRGKAEEYVERLDKCLASKTPEAVWEYMNIANERELREHCITANQKISYAVIFRVITSAEIKKRKQACFIAGGNSLDDLVKIFKQLEFALWELEFDGGEQAEQRLYDTILRYNITEEAVYCAMAFASKNKNDMVKKVSEIYSAHGLEWTI